MDAHALKCILEAVVMAADSPLSVERLHGLFGSDEGAPSRDDVRAALTALMQDYAERGIELAAVAGGYRFQTRGNYAEWVNRLWEDRKPRYSRALLETLAIVAYRQPITRGEIEDIRGVAVSTGIMKTLLEREWLKVVGHRDVPGRPAIYATTRQFLEYFNLDGLDALPTLAELKDFDDVNTDLFIDMETALTEAENSADVIVDASAAGDEDTIAAVSNEPDPAT